MTRFHQKDTGEIIAFTPEEEAERDAQEAAWEAQKAIPTPPTKEQLMAELAALTSKIQALE